MGAGHVLAQLAWFFSKLAVVTFGGAYAVLAYMAQDVVARHGWLDARQMVDSLGLAETTPGTLILVNLFVGFLAAASAHPEQALALGLAGKKASEAFLERFLDFLAYLLPRYHGEGKSYLTIGVGCTGGRHRSVVVAERLKGVLQRAGYPASLHHRDLAQPPQEPAEQGENPGGTAISRQEKAKGAPA